jgi:hypothetical protein
VTLCLVFVKHSEKRVICCFKVIKRKKRNFWNKLFLTIT